MVKKLGPRLRDTVSWLSLVAGTRSRNLGVTFFYFPVTLYHRRQTDKRQHESVDLAWMTKSPEGEMG